MPSSRSIQLRSSLRDDLRLTAVEGVGIRTVWTFLSEVGTDVSKFASAEHFASWLGLCPDNRIIGGRKLAAHTRTVNNRLATALRMAAQILSSFPIATGRLVPAY